MYIINVKSRVDRRFHITAEFERFPEFDPVIVNPVPHEHAPVSLWLTIRKIVEMAQESELDHVIFCEDDHCFTGNYNIDSLLKAIQSAQDAGADVLFGGVSWFSNAIEFNDNIFWVEHSSGLQFTVIFKRFYTTLLKKEFGAFNAADTVISSISDRKYFIYPFISVQKEFGYSDITPKNNNPGNVIALFDRSIAKSNAIKMLYDAYQPIGNLGNHNNHQGDNEGFTILTMVSGDVGMREFSIMEKELSKANTFRLKLLEKPGNTELMYLKQAVDIAIKEEEELFIFINSAISLSEGFTKDFLYECVIQAYQNGGDMLLGAVNDFDFAVPVSENLFWVNQFISSPFIIFFKSSFNKIQEIIENENASGFPVISSLSVKKFAVFPFLINTDQLKAKYFSDENNYSLSRIANKMPGERLSQFLEIVQLNSLQKTI